MSGTPIGHMSLIQPGPCALLQDLGRCGAQHLGYAAGGAIDTHAFCWANRLLDNNINNCALEITLGPFAARFTDKTQIAVTGAASEIVLNRRPCPSWTSINIEAGDELLIKNPQQGVRSYLAIKGGFNFSADFASATMVMRENSGPHKGQALKKHHELSYKVTQAQSRQTKYTPDEFIPDYSEAITLRVLLNTRKSLFTEDALAEFFNQTYDISPQSNRMAYQLEGSQKIRASGESVLSHGVALGTIQIPPHGNPIVLLNDRQTIGGYPTVGCVAQLDCFALSQRRPGQHVRFTRWDLAEAQRQLGQFLHFFMP